jgi:hypothetical protein
MTGKRERKKRALSLLEVLEKDLGADREPIAIAWQPKEDETLEAEFRRWSVRTDYRGINQPVAIVRDDAGQLLSVWCSPVVLGKAMRRADPQPGDRLKIKRLGDCVSIKKRTYKMFTVEILSRAKANESSPATNGPTPRADSNQIGWNHTTAGKSAQNSGRGATPRERKGFHI